MANFFNMNKEIAKPQNEKLQNNVVLQQVPNLNAAAAFSIVGSVAAEENALAALIQEEADKLALLTGASLTLDNFTDLAGSITRTMKTVLLKNTVLEAKLTETLNYIDEENLTITPAFVDNLTAILSRIANEENALGNLIRALGTIVGLLAPGLSLEQLQDVDRLIVLPLMRVITEKNLVLLSKFRRVVRFIVNNSADFPPPTAAQVAAVIAAINAMINSIIVEENGLAVLIEAEATKLDTAIDLTTTAGDIDDLLAFNEIITSVIDIIVQKNMILESKLEDILALITIENGFTPAQLAVFAATLSNLQQSIANEEFALAALIGTESLKINAVANVTPGDIDNLVSVNESASLLLESITLKNMILAQKNIDVINFILSL